MSDYLLSVKNDADGAHLCDVEVDEVGLDRAREVIADGYVAEWIVDNLPGATSFISGDKSKKYYAAGFPMGREEVDKKGRVHYYLNNHVTLLLLYRNAPGKAGAERGEKVIVGFEVYPKSIEAGDRNKDGVPKHIEKPKHPFEIPAAKPMIAGQVRDTTKIPYTYSVVWKEEPGVEWNNRWDVYFVNQEESAGIHWFAIINSLVICGLLTAVVAVILARTIRGDIAATSGKDIETQIKMKRRHSRAASRAGLENENGILAQAKTPTIPEEDEENLEDITGWKLLHGDVFRTPFKGGLLAPLVGSGTQLIFMAFGLVALSCLGVLNPSFRGGFESVGFALFIFAGVFSGYYSGRLFATFGHQRWRRNVLITASLVPGLLFTIVFVLNFFVWAQASSTAIPFSTLLALLTLWLAFQLPLVYLGSYYGYTRVGAWTAPNRTNVIARQIPAGPANSRSREVWTILAAGFVPFAVVFIELLFAFRNLYQDRTSYYYVFGFLALTLGILLVTIIEVSIVFTYLRLCNENWHWQWYSFFIGGASSVWVFGYAAWFYFMRLHITGFVSSMLFFAYVALACAAYGVLAGTVGFLSAYAFVRRIYGTIKVD